MAQQRPGLLFDCSKTAVEVDVQYLRRLRIDGQF
jgi:hypothetical protein